jgi:hypothetical protein
MCLEGRRGADTKKMKKSSCRDKDHSIKNTNPLFLVNEVVTEIKMYHKSCFVLLPGMLVAIVLS